MEAVSILCQVQPLLRIANLYVKLSNFEGGEVKCLIQGNSLSMEMAGMKLLLNFPKLVKLQDGCSFKATVDDCYIHVRMPSGVPEGNPHGSDSTEVIRLPSSAASHQFGTNKKMWIPKIGVKSVLKCSQCSAVLVEGTLWIVNFFFFHENYKLFHGFSRNYSIIEWQRFLEINHYSFNLVSL